MDHMKKRLLSQSIAYLQGALTLTANLLEALFEHNVITSDELSTIQVRSESKDLNVKTVIIYI